VLTDLEDRRVTLVTFAGSRGSAVGEMLRVEAVITGDAGSVIRMETPDPDILSLDGCKVSMEFFNDGVYLSLDGILEVKVAGPAYFVFVLGNMSEPVEIQRRNWVRAALEVDAVVEVVSEGAGVGAATAGAAGAVASVGVGETAGSGAPEGLAMANIYATRTVDISAGGVRLRPILDEGKVPVVAKGDRVMVAIDLVALSPGSPARGAAFQPASRHLPPSSPLSRSALARVPASRSRLASARGVVGAGGVATSAGSSSAGSSSAGSSSAGSSSAGPPPACSPFASGGGVWIPAKVVQSDRKALRLMFTQVSEAVAKILTRTVFDAQMPIRKGSR